MHKLRARGVYAALTMMLVLALTGRVLVPAGFMPGQEADGRAALVICTGAGPATIMVGPEHNPQAPDTGNHETRADSSCAFAPVLAFGPGLTAPAAALPLPAPPRIKPLPAPVVAALPPHDYRAQAPPAFLA